MKRLPRFSFGFAVCLLAPLTAPAADGKTGEQIYRGQCARCHGANGEGVKDEYPDPLVGDKSVAQLAKLIARTMPKEKPGTCVGEDADRVAAYVHDAFYSREARERNKPPRVELARLTVRQYRTAVADLVGSFRPAPKPGDQRGLRGEYYNSRNFRGDRRALERTDPEVRFDFKTDSPLKDKIEPHEFAIRWSGSVIADETGVYEFVVRTDHAVNLWVNDNAKPLVDAWVKSGSDTEHRGVIFLVAGRAYPLRLEFSKAKQGVDDKKAKEKPPAPAMVALEWKRPGFAQDVIPARNLIPTGVPESCVISTPFPPDDRSLGWERGTTVSKAWEAATTDAALEAAAYVSAKVNELAGTHAGAKDRAAKAREFCRKFAERAFRRPLTEEQKRVYIDRQFDAVTDVEPAVKRVVLLVLKSPRFLYREVGGPGAYAVAERLSFALWDSLPDPELLSAAASNRLTTREQVAKQAERMLADPLAKAKLHEFVRHWLTVDRAIDVAKDAKKFPGFDPAVASDLKTSLDLFLDDVLTSPASDFRRFLLDDETYLNGRLAKLYGADLPADAGFRKVKLDAERRAGVLTHPYLMSAFAYTGETSPIHRGVFLARGVLGITLKPPMEAFTPLPAEQHPTLTTRERVSLQTKPQACQTCHTVINPLGFTLEHFDAIGRYREQENGKPVEDRGQYLTRDGKPVTFAGAKQLAAFLANSDEVHVAFVEKLFHHLVQQPVRAYGPRTAAELREKFAASGYSVKRLAVEIATTAAMR